MYSLTGKIASLMVALYAAMYTFDLRGSSVEWGISKVNYEQAGYCGSDWLFVIGRPYLNIKADVVGTSLLLTAVPDSNMVNANTFVKANKGDVVSQEYIAAKGEYFAWAQYGNPTVRTDYQIIVDDSTHVYLAFAADYAAYDTVRYGWVEIGLDDRGHLAAFSSAWDVDGDAIRVGDVPEPSTGMLFTLALAALALKRRRGMAVRDL